jgi:hypothetical protein
LNYFDLTPSFQTNLVIQTSNHISIYHLPIRSVVFALIFSIIVSVNAIVIRSILLLLTVVFYIIFHIFNRTESLKSVRNIKLILTNLVYLGIAIVLLIASVSQQSINLMIIDIVVVALAILGLGINFIGFIVNVGKS